MTYLRRYSLAIVIIFSLSGVLNADETKRPLLKSKPLPTKILKIPGSKIKVKEKIQIQPAREPRFATVKVSLAIYLDNIKKAYHGGDNVKFMELTILLMEAYQRSTVENRKKLGTDFAKYLDQKGPEGLTPLMFHVLDWTLWKGDTSFMTALEGIYEKYHNKKGQSGDSHFDLKGPFISYDYVTHFFGIHDGRLSAVLSELISPPNRVKANLGEYARFDLIDLIDRLEACGSLGMPPIKPQIPAKSVGQYCSGVGFAGLMRGSVSKHTPRSRSSNGASSGRSGGGGGSGGRGSRASNGKAPQHQQMMSACMSEFKARQSGILNMGAECGGSHLLTMDGFISFLSEMLNLSQPKVTFADLSKAGQVSSGGEIIGEAAKDLVVGLVGDYAQDKGTELTGDPTVGYAASAGVGVLDLALTGLTSAADLGGPVGIVFLLKELFGGVHDAIEGGYGSAGRSAAENGNFDQWAYDNYSSYRTEHDKRKAELTKEAEDKKRADAQGQKDEEAKALAESNKNGTGTKTPRPDQDGTSIIGNCMAKHLNLLTGNKPSGVINPKTSHVINPHPDAVGLVDFCGSSIFKNAGISRHALIQKQCYLSYHPDKDCFGLSELNGMTNIQPKWINATDPVRPFGISGATTLPSTRLSGTIPSNPLPTKGLNINNVLPKHRKPIKQINIPQSKVTPRQPGHPLDDRP